MKHQNYSLIKLLSLFLACLLSLSLFAACGEKEGDEDGTGSGSDTNVPAKEIALFENGAFTAQMIYPEDEEKDMRTLRNRIVSALRMSLGANVTAKQDSEVASDETTLEILIGATDRTESAMPEDLASTDYWYYVGMKGNKFVINASDINAMEVAVELFIDEFLGNATTSLSVTDRHVETVHYRDFSKSGWQQKSIPYYQGNNTIYSSLSYDCGPAILDMVDSSGEIEMQTVNGTTREEFEAYVERLKSVGYTVEEKNEIESNVYVTLYNGRQRVHTYFTKSRNKTTVIVDPFSVSAKEFSYTTEIGKNGGATFYLYGLQMDPGGYNPSGKNDSYLNTTGFVNNGECMVIKLADNSLIIVDGGAALQMTGVDKDYAPLNAFNDFLHEITGKSKTEKVTIAAWFMSHPHGDHIGGFKTFIDRVGEQYELQRICLNLAATGDLVSTDENNTMKSISSIISKKWPNCMEMKLHTGQILQLSDVTLQVLYTHEDNTKSSGKTAITGTNDACTVLRVSTEGMSMFLWNDADTSTESVIMRAFTATTLKSDIVQVAHHGFNKLTTALKAINAPIAFFPQAEGGMHKNSSQQAIFDIIDKYSDTMYFSGKHELTVGLAYRDGEIKAVYTAAK